MAMSEKLKGKVALITGERRASVGAMRDNADGAQSAIIVNSSMNAHRPMGRMAQVEEVAALVSYLASDEAAIISGSEHGIDRASTVGMMGV
jgi:3(or 17)beta-hydroxysteroid dehydrogenase